MFELPELDGLAADELNVLLAAARSEAADMLASLNDPATADSVDVDRIEALSGHVDTLEAKLSDMAAAKLARAEKATALQAKFAAKKAAPADDNDEDDNDGKKMAVVDAPVVAAVAKPKASAKAVVAAAPKAESTTDTREVAIVAAAGVPGMVAGQTGTLMDFVKPAIQKWTSYQGLSGSGSQSDMIFQLKAPARDDRMVAKSTDHMAGTEVMKYATDAKRLAATNGASGIVAAGGWCAPAEQRFDVCTLAELDGILDVPTISMPRGSLSYFRQLDYALVASDLASAGNFSFTNSQLVANPPVVKPCFEIPCQTPVTATLDARGLCLRAGILQQKAFPELIAAWMDLALIAHAHYLNAFNLAEMVAGSLAVDFNSGTSTFGAISQLLEAVDLQAMDLRFSQGMAVDADLEAVFPWWVPALLAADFSKRQFIDGDGGGSPFSAYGMAEFTADLAKRNVRAQFVKDLDDTIFQTSATATVGSDSADASPVLGWPKSIKFLLYPPGAWVRGTEDIISVSTLYDSTLLQTNRVQLLFIEAGSKMLPWCGNSRYVTVAVCPSGATSGPIADVPGVYVCPTAG